MAAPIDLTETGQANGALALIGEPPITSLDDTTRAAARYAKRFFAEERDALLREKDWQFARMFVTPGAVVSPNTNWGWRYSMPPDCLAVVRIGDYENYTDEPEWEEVSTGDDATLGVFIDTNEVSAKIYYTRRVVNPAQWDVDFQSLFRTRLAIKLNPLIGRDRALTAQLQAMAENREDKSAKRDSQQRRGDTISRTTAWVTSRWGFYNGRR